MNIGGRQQANAAKQTRSARRDWPEHEQYFLRTYREATYYSSGRGWLDYAPAYRYGFVHYGRYRGRRFEEVEVQLENDWVAGRGESRLAWAEARGAVRDIWQRLDQDAPGEQHQAFGRKQ